MAYDPKQRPWVNLGNVEPREMSGLDPVFSIRPVLEMLRQTLGDEHIPLREIFNVRWPPDFSTSQLLYEDPLVQRLFRDADFWVQKGNLVFRKWLSHRNMHDWLDRRRITSDYPPVVRVKSDIKEFLLREPHWDSELQKDRRPVLLASTLEEHEINHCAFRLWCIFREAVIRIEVREQFPEWLTEDLDRLAKQATVELDTSSKPRIVAGPANWAIEVLGLVQRDGTKRGSDSLIKVCNRCDKPFEECRPGRPSPRCPTCRPIGRHEDDRERKRAKRDSRRVVPG